MLTNRYFMRVADTMHVLLFKDALELHLTHNERLGEARRMTYTENVFHGADAKDTALAVIGYPYSNFNYESETGE